MGNQKESLTNPVNDLAPAIPLQKYREFYFPLTPKSTINLWAKQGYFQNKGPFAGKVTKYGGRWYVETVTDPVTKKIVKSIKDLFGQENDI